MVSANRTRFDPPSPRSSASAGAFDTATASGGTVSVTRNGTFQVGSSKQGNTRRASPGWSCVRA